MKKVAIIGSRRMSPYGKEVINQLLITNYELKIKNLEIVTIRVSGCNSEVIKRCEEIGLKCKIFEGENFEKLNEELAEYADILVVIEGGNKSGTILAAKNFLDLGKEIWAVPGRITDENSEMTNYLIDNGARPLIEVTDLTGSLQ
jgi:predicted Rossmann fold nucleotide-binding protein DprA/Smf involved in DNA uptake